MQLLRANTAVDVLIGPFLDSTNGNDVESGLTIEDEHVRLSKNGQNMIPKAEATNATHDELGYYNCPLDTTDTNTEGMLDLCCHMSGALAVRHQYMVMAEAAYDSLFAAKDAGFMDVNIKTIGRVDTTETEATNLEAACAAYSVTRGLTGTAVPDAVADAAGGLMVSDDGGWDADELYDAIVTDAAGTNIAADIIAIKAVAGALNDAAAAGEVTEADTLMQYLKQLINILIGTTGITAWPAEAAPANGVSIAEAIRAIAVDVATTIPGTITTAQADLDTITGTSGVIIEDGSIVAASLGADCITNAKIADDAIAAENLKTGAISADAFAADAIVAATLATGALSADAFAADALVAATFATGCLSADAFAANALVAATFNADCITAAKVAPDVHTENATACWAKTEAVTGNTNTYGSMVEKVFRFMMNDMLITDATGAVALRNEANDGDIATQGITDNATTTTRTDLVWV